MTFSRTRRWTGNLSKRAEGQVIESLSKYKAGAETLATAEVETLSGDGPIDVRVDGTTARSTRTSETEIAPPGLRMVCAVPQPD